MTQELRRHARKLLAMGLYFSGLLWIYTAVCLRHRAVILTYHRVLPANADSYSTPGIRVQPETFGRHMEFLRRHFKVLSAEDLVTHIERREVLPSRSCVVTFDDGWQDNYDHALPVLNRERIPAIIFVAANYVGSDQGFWQERLARRMHRAFVWGGEPRSFVVQRAAVRVETLDAPDLKSVLRSSVTRMKLLPVTHIEAFERELCQLMQEAGIPEGSAGDDRFMSWQQLAGLARQSAVTIGAHGCTHIPLTALAEDDVAREMSACRDKISKSTGSTATAIAYPDGKANTLVAALAHAAGFRVGFTTEPGLVTSEDNRFLMRRVNVHESSAATIPEFLCTLLGVFHRAAGSDRNARTGY